MFVELKCKSNFSFLRGASDAREYIERAYELRMPAVAITDLNGVYGIPRAYEATKAYPDVKLIVGTELTFVDHPNLTILARTRGAYAVICRLITQLHRDKEKTKGNLHLQEFLEACSQDARAKDLVVLPNIDLENTKSAQFFRLKEEFGSRLYLPICMYLDGLDERRMAEALAINQQYDIELVATNDVHYHTPERRKIQDCLTCIREKVTLTTAGKKLFKNSERYLKSPLQMRSLFRDFPDSIQSSLEIAESCTFKLSELSYTYPRELVPAGHTPQSYFEDLVSRGAQKIYKGMISFQVDEQIRKEFKLIREKNYASYFLTLYDIVEFARSKDIICQGRGSAANSICCYCLGITAIDPVRMNLLFERFMSEERDEPPDIDVDFEHERREEVLQYVYARYGRERAGMISAVRTYQRKSAFLEVSKAIGVDVGTISADSLQQQFEQRAGVLLNKKVVVEQLTQDLVGFPRHLSIHSGGFTLSQDPIIETVPIEPARMKDRTIIQWDKNDLDTVGLLKVDLLSLGFLTALHKCCNYLGISWQNIPPEDPKTYDMICRAETEGCFQIESRAQKSMLTRTRPRTFYDLVVQVAIVRPGPSVGQMVHPYIQRREQAKRGVPYLITDPDIKSVLGRTYGVPVFQEQLMKIAILKAGFTAGQANQLRRTLAAWRSADGIDEMSQKLHEGLLKNGVSAEWADELFKYMKGYAHYGFPESHAASFALIAYASAYLKCHHPAEFLCALVNSQPMGFYAIDTLIMEAKRQGVIVLPIHPEFSDWDAKMAGPQTVRMGFRNVRRIREEDVKWMNPQNERMVSPSDMQTAITEEALAKHFLVLETERKNGTFSDLYDFIKRTRFSQDVIELMALADVFACFGHDQRHTFWQSIEFHNLFQRSENLQLSLFVRDPTPVKSYQAAAGAPSSNGALPVGQNLNFKNDPSFSQIFEKMTLIQQIVADYRATGYSVRGNAMTALRKSIPDLPPLTSQQVKKLNHGIPIYFAGILTVLQRPPTAKGVAFITLEDDVGSLDLICKKEVYEKFQYEIKNFRFLIIQGKVQKIRQGVSVIVSHIKPFLTDGQKPIPTGVTSRSFGPPIFIK